MFEVQVVFPAANSPTQTTMARVLTTTLVARQRDRVTWTFFNCDTRIGYAEIEFQNTTHQFFPGTANPHKFGKNVGGSGDIYGDVPDLNVTRPVLSKYTVRGWNNPSKSQLCSEHDPEILIYEP